MQATTIPEALTAEAGVVLERWPDDVGRLTLIDAELSALGGPTIPDGTEVTALAPCIQLVLASGD